MNNFEKWLVREPAGPKPRKPLKRTPLKRSTKPIARVSRKAGKELRKYFALRAEYLAANTACEAGPVILKARLPDFYRVPRCSGRSTEIHHTKRRGPHLNDVDSFCGTCPECHRWIHEHAQKSRELGLLV